MRILLITLFALIATTTCGSNLRTPNIFLSLIGEKNASKMIDTVMRSLPVDVVQTVGQSSIFWEALNKVNNWSEVKECAKGLVNSLKDLVAAVQQYVADHDKDALVNRVKEIVAEGQDVVEQHCKHIV